jgi:hypothetical protein
MRPAPADHRLTFAPLGVAAIVFAATACGGTTPAGVDAGVDAAASDALAVDLRVDRRPATNEAAVELDAGVVVADDRFDHTAPRRGSRAAPSSARRPSSLVDRGRPI